MRYSGLWLSAMVTLACTGCATGFYSMRREVHDETRATLSTVLQKNPLPSLSIIRDKAYVPAKYIPYSPDYGNISLKSEQAPFYALLAGIARQAGYSLSMTQGVVSGQLVTVNILNQSAEAAMRHIALAAGYAIIFDATLKTATIARVATDTFRLPLEIMQQLTARYDVGGNPVNSSDSAGSGPSLAMSAESSSIVSGNSINGSGIQAGFTVNGSYQTDSGSLGKFIHELAGFDAQVHVMPELGLVSVRSDAVSLERVHSFLEKFTQDAMRRVEIQASIIEVDLGSQFEYGLDWSRILGSTTASLSDASSVINPVLAVNVTSASIQGVLDALQKVTTLKVISQPRVTAMNHTPAVIFDGTQIPYLGSISNSVTGTAGTSVTSGAASYVTDGISLSIEPDILDQDYVQLTIVPVLSTVESFSTFNLNGNTITAPTQATKQSLMEVLDESGKTLILGGIRSSSDNATKDALPGLGRVPFLGSLTSPGQSDHEAHKEVVILLHADIIPAPPFEPLFSEAI